jgi:hypothetical protein
MYDAFVKKIIVYTKMDILDILHKETNIFIYAGMIDALELLGCIIDINIRAKCGYVHDAKNNSISSNHIKSLTDTYYTLINNFIKIFVSLCNISSISILVYTIIFLTKASYIHTSPIFMYYVFYKKIYAITRVY